MKNLLDSFDENFFRCIGCKNFHEIKHFNKVLRVYEDYLNFSAPINLITPKHKWFVEYIKKYTPEKVKWWTNLNISKMPGLCESCCRTLYCLGHTDKIRLFRSWIDN